MLLSDNETKVDMLNNRAIAKTITNIICECDEQPISIGVHGDWGAGKSSILAMAEVELSEKDSDIQCIRFNGWKHQGFEDAKIALMSSILSELSKNQKLTNKAKEAIQRLWKNINWLSVVKATGSTAFSLATGLPPVGLRSGVLDTLKSAVGDKEKVESTIQHIGDYMTDAKIFENNSLSKEFTEFQGSFETLLKESKISKLVVLIDDLDRCLPNVTIETLEAVRLFMFTPSTAFVIAADEAMIEYAVHEHFPNLSDGMTGNDYDSDYSKRYLEKLIQVPFKIPALGEVESEMYITLLMIASKIRENDEQFNALLEVAVDKMKKPWENDGLSILDIQTSLDEKKYNSVGGEIAVANQISEVLSKHTQGNPRKIKRFLNMLLLRKQMADARGFGESINVSILAKLMLAEYYFNSEYRQLASLTDVDGKCPQLAELEDKLVKTHVADGEEPIDGADDTATISKTQTDEQRIEESSQVDEWTNNPVFVKWAASEPKLGDVDLRPYFFASKEREDIFFERIKSEQLRSLIDKLMGQSFNVASANDEIQGLSQDEALTVFNALSAKIRKESDISREPKGIAGVRTMAAMYSSLEEPLLALIESFDCKSVGVWICKGWDKSILSDAGKNRLGTYFERLSKEGTTLVKAAVKTTKK